MWTPALCCRRMRWLAARRLVWLAWSRSIKTAPLHCCPALEKNKTLTQKKLLWPHCVSVKGWTLTFSLFIVLMTVSSVSPRPLPDPVSSSSASKSPQRSPSWLPASTEDVSVCVMKFPPFPLCPSLCVCQASLAWEKTHWRHERWLAFEYFWLL